MQAIIAQANQMIQQGMPQAQVEAWIQQQAQQGGLNPQPVTGQPQADAPAAPQAGAQSPPMSGMGGGLPSAAPAQFGVGVPKSAASSDVIGNRATQFDQLVSQGAVDPKSPDFQSQRNTYLATGKMGSDFQGGGSIAPIGDYTKSGAEYLATVPPAEQGTMKSLLNGTIPMPTGSALKSPLWQSMMAGAVHADPSWNSGAYKQYADTRKYFTVGKGGTTISNISTAMAHADEMLDTVNALNNGNIRPLAAGENYLSSVTGKTPVTNFGSVLTALASEMASVYKNGNAPTDQETNHWREQLNANMSKGQQTDVLRHWVDLLTGKMNSVQQQYRSGMSNMADPLTVISPDARAAMSRINAFSDKLNARPEAIRRSMTRQSMLRASKLRSSVASHNSRSNPANRLHPVTSRICGVDNA